MACLACISLLQAQVPKEYQVKAALLYNFTKFVEWPPGRFDTEHAPLIIGVFGKNLFGAELQNAVQGRKLGTHDIVVKQLTSTDEAATVHLLFVPTAEDAHTPALLQTLQNQPVLTVGESAAFAKSGGMINFVLEGDKVRFEINGDASAQAGLRISAQLMKLAKTVRRHE